MKASEYSQLMKQLPLALYAADAPARLQKFFAEFNLFVKALEDRNPTERHLSFIETSGIALAKAAKRNFTRLHETYSVVHRNIYFINNRFLGRRLQLITYRNL